MESKEKENSVFISESVFRIILIVAKKFLFLSEY